MLLWGVATLAQWRRLLKCHKYYRLTYRAERVDESPELRVEGLEPEGGRVHDLGDGKHPHAEDEAARPHEEGIAEAAEHQARQYPPIEGVSERNNIFICTICNHSPYFSSSLFLFQIFLVIYSYVSNRCSSISKH